MAMPSLGPLRAWFGTGGKPYLTAASSDQKAYIDLGDPWNVMGTINLPWNSQNSALKIALFCGNMWKLSFRHPI